MSSRSSSRRTTRSTDPVISRRDSLRSSKKPLLLVQLNDSRRAVKRKKRTTATHDSECSTISSASATVVEEDSSPVSKKRRLLTSPSLSHQEKALTAREWECDLREETLSFQEAKMQLEKMDAKMWEAKAALQQLEDDFTCSLCYEVIANPYALNPRSCGHSFCAICILKWFFSRLHKACGGWHESVDCPICRSLLVITPDRVPRLDITFPFVPNRLAAAVCESLLEKVRTLLQDVKKGRRDRAGLMTEMEQKVSAMKVKRRELNDRKAHLAKQSRARANEGHVWQIDQRLAKLAQNVDKWTAELLQMENSEGMTLYGWKQGGSARSEWLKRDREGKREMNHLLSQWTRMTSQDFVTMKHRLAV